MQLKEATGASGRFDNADVEPEGTEMERGQKRGARHIFLGQICLTLTHTYLDLANMLLLSFWCALCVCCCSSIRQTTGISVCRTKAHPWTQHWSKTRRFCLPVCEHAGEWYVCKLPKKTIRPNLMSVSLVDLSFTLSQITGKTYMSQWHHNFQAPPLAGQKNNKTEK